MSRVLKSSILFLSNKYNSPNAKSMQNILPNIVDIIVATPSHKLVVSLLRSVIVIPKYANMNDSQRYPIVLNVHTVPF